MQRKVLVAVLTLLIDNAIAILLTFMSKFPNLQWLFWFLIVVLILGNIGVVVWEMRSKEGTEQRTGNGRVNDERQILLKKAQIPIEQAISSPLYKEARIALGLQEDPDAFDHPLKVQFYENIQPEHVPQGTPNPDKSAKQNEHDHIRQVYDNAHCELLILGAAGAGKTTSLLELAQDLIECAKQNEHHPIPFVFNLTSWAKKRKPLAEWLVEELNNKYTYNIPLELCQSLVHDNQILPLLDGLDTVGSMYLSACVDAINTYRREHGLVPLVVCCRETDYNNQERTLDLKKVIIKQLTEVDVDKYLEKAGKPMEAVRFVLQGNSNLRELVTTPLMINVLTLAYRGKTKEELPKMGSAEEQQQQVLASYVERMLVGNRGASSRYTSKQTMYWLAWLARQLVNHRQSAFLIELMQPDWLPNSRLRRIYRLVIVLTFGLYIGLVGAIVGGFIGGLIGNFAAGPITGRASAREFISGLAPWPIQHLFGGLVANLGLVLIAGSGASLIAGLGLGLSAGLVIGLIISQTEITPSEAVKWSWKKAKKHALLGGVFGFLIGWIGIGLVAELTIGHVKSTISSLIFGPIGGVDFGLVLGLVADLLSSMSDKSASSRRYRPGIGTAGGLIIGLIIGMNGSWIREWIYGLVSEVSNGFVKTLIFGLIYGLVVGLVVAVTLGLAGGLSSDMLETRDFARPSQGTRTSARNSFIYGLIGAFFLGVSAGVAGGFTGGPGLGLITGIVGGLIGGVVGGLLFGGIAWLQHTLLSIILWRAGYTPRPWEYITFLDYSTNCNLLRRVSGGYSFYHDLFKDYFASFDGTVFAEQKLSRREAIIIGGRVVLAVGVWGAAMYSLYRLLTPRNTLLYTYRGHSSDVRMVAWSPTPNNNRIASASWDHTVQVWDAFDGLHVLPPYHGHKRAVTAVAWSPDGKFLASGSDDSSVQIWQAASGKYVLSCLGPRDRIESLAWSPDGKFLASGNWDNNVYVWNATDGRLRQTYKGHHDHVWSIAWSPDSKLIASASWDHTVQVWDALTGKPLQTYHGHLGSVFGVAWSPYGHLIASGSIDKTVRVWNATDGKTLMVYQGHTDHVLAVAWSPDGKYIASGGSDNSVQIWNATDGWFLMNYTHSEGVNSVAWSPNSEYIVSGSGDNTVQVHRMI